MTSCLGRQAGVGASQVTGVKRPRIERVWDPQRLDFAEFYREFKDECLFIVLVSAGDRDAQALVGEAFARAWASRRTVSRHRATAARVVRTALNASISRWRRRRREVPAPDLPLVADRPAADGAPAVRSIPGSWRHCSGYPPGNGKW